MPVPGQGERPSPSLTRLTALIDAATVCLEKDSHGETVLGHAEFRLADLGKVSSMPQLRRRVAESRLAGVAALPLRAREVARCNAHLAKVSAQWLVKSREHTNYTYNLTPLNREHLAWWVADVAAVDVETVRGYISELEEDRDLREHVEAATAASPRRRLADREARYGRRAGWYALVRALRPEHVVEAGTDKGTGACVFAAALIRNGCGELTTVDINPDSGYLVTGRYAEVTTRLIGDSVEVLSGSHSSVDMFLHDSRHTFEHELAEFRAIAPRLSWQAVVLSDNAHVTNALSHWSEAKRRQFLYFAEQPADHWYPGAGIGASFRR
jgi:predicted O-methyltransferase YrrM